MDNNIEVGKDSQEDMVLCISIGIEELHGLSYCSAKTLLKIRTSIEVRTLCGTHAGGDSLSYHIVKL